MTQPMSWVDANQKYLVLALAHIRACLNAHLARNQLVTSPSTTPNVQVASGRNQSDLTTTSEQLLAHVKAMSAPPAMASLQRRFRLSEFEIGILLLCAGMELEAHFAGLCASAQGDTNRPYPTFSLALAALPSAYWSALMATAPLRKHELIEFANAGEGNSAPLTTRPLRITERVLHFLTGVSHTLDDRLNGLAEQIEPRATWDDLVLPHEQVQILRTLVMHVRQRNKVYGEWGFAKKSARGLGISALFAGASGTGKTLAAEVLANELRLELYRIDLSSVVSKYIGETEKNLRRVFDAAEGSAAILLFDEADALFGKRSEVKDSHDRYANIEVGYLLQRMESYRGLAVLTTNLKHSLDAAFKRRIRFEMNFPFPDAEGRAEIWQRVFPVQTPTRGLDAHKLAQLNIAGGNIRNIAMNAAFLAADEAAEHSAVTMAHVLAATQSEYAKLDRPLMESETAGWFTEHEPELTIASANGSMPVAAAITTPKVRKRGA